MAPPTPKSSSFPFFSSFYRKMGTPLILGESLWCSFFKNFDGRLFLARHKFPCFVSQATGFWLFLHWVNCMFYSPFPNTGEKSVECQLYDLHFPIICRKKKKEEQAPIALEMHSLQDWNLSPSSSSLLNPQHSNRVSVSHFPKKEEKKSLNKKREFSSNPFSFLSTPATLEER